MKHTYRFRVETLTSRSRADQLKHVLEACFAPLPGGQKVNTDTASHCLTVMSTDPLDIEAMRRALEPQGFALKDWKGATVANVCVDGMTCKSCEVIIERKWKRLPGVTHVDVNANTGKARLTCTEEPPTVEQLQNALGEGKYVVSLNGGGEKTKPSFLEIAGLFALVLLLGKILANLGLLKTSFTVGNGMSFGAIFVVGLVAASSSCIAVAGGLLLSAAAKFNERYTSASPMGRMRPVFLFVVGRIVGYGILGGLLGVVGKALSPSPFVTAIVTLAAALYMLTMGLDMLQIAPAWLKRLTPKMPKALSRKVMDAEGKEHPLAPLLLGAATFFLPCGFTQALQLYALTTGSFTAGALSLFAFALGTAPALLALGWASSSLKGKFGRFFFSFSGALVVVLGLWNIQNGLAIAGYPLSFPSFGSSAVANAGSGTDTAPAPTGDVQVVKMAVTPAGYVPSRLTVRAGVPVRWEVDGAQAGGCGSVLVSRALGIQKLLDRGLNVFEFTPKSPGEIAFNCSMGMYRGSFTVTN